MRNRQTFESLEDRRLLDGDGPEFSGTLPLGDITWSAEQGPYHVVGDVEVPVGTTLRIEPGVAVFFDEGRELSIRGTLIARGTSDQRILFSSVPNAPFVPDRPNGVVGLPDGSPRWKGIHFRDSRSEHNEISQADIEYAQSDDGAIGVIGGNAVVDGVRFSGTHLHMIYGNNASLAVRNSRFPDMFAANESPGQLGLDNISEHIKIIGRPPVDGQLIIQGNTFGTNKGHNDVIDADSGRRPDPILQILDNVFAGVGDELLDLGGDAYVAGNVFQNVSEDKDNQGARFANAISTGDEGLNSTIVAVRNVFYDIEHAMHLRFGDAAIFENNTVVQVHPPGSGLGSALAMYAQSAGEEPGRGAHVSGNIFWDVPTVFGNVDLPEGQISGLSFDDNLVSDTLAATKVGNRPGGLLDLGTGNVIGDPKFVDAAHLDFRLAPDSSAIGAGPFGNDLGAFVPTGAWVAGEPVGMTQRNSASLTIGGPGIFAFRYRVNDGLWSDVISIGKGFGFDLQGTVRTVQVALTDLSPGEYRVDVVGQDFAGNWQFTPTSSASWTVGSTKGDLNGDGTTNFTDIDLICMALRTPPGDPAYDLNTDGEVSIQDLDHLIQEILGTSFGDANLDGVFNSSDLVSVFQAGRYEDERLENVSWSEGDWNCDGRFSTADLVVAFQRGESLHR